MNYITLSTGERITRKAYDNRITAAKKQKIDEFIEENGYVYCEICERNDCKPVDCSHDKSVDWCIKNGCPELAYDIDNITLRGRDCHKKYDGLDLQFNII